MKTAAKDNSFAQAQQVYNLNLKSTNACTGPIPVSITSGDSCDPICPFYNKGCYGKAGPISWIWRKVSGSWAKFVADVSALPAGQLWRHNQVGDLPGKGSRIDRAKLRELTEANSGKRGFTFTHKRMTLASNQAAVREANANGFTINLSADNLAEADELAALGIGPVAVVVPTEQHENTLTPAGRRVVICPNKIGRRNAAGEVITCDKCGLCQKAQRPFIVAFPAHGIYKSAVSEIVKDKTN